MGELIITQARVDNIVLNFDRIEVPRPDGLGTQMSAINLHYTGEATFKFTSSGEFPNIETVRRMVEKFLFLDNPVIK